MTEDGLRVTHQLRLDAIADADPRQLGLLKIAVDPVAVGIDDRDVSAALMRKVAGPHQKVGDIAIDRAANLGSAQVDLRLRYLLLRSVESSLCVDRGAGKDLLFLRGSRQARQPLPPLGLNLLDLQIGGPLLCLR